MPPPPKQPHPDVLSLSRHMSALKLPFMLEHHQAYAQSAADKHWSHLDFVKQRGNVVFISGPGMGKSHLMTALGHAACQRGHSVLFTGAIEIINTLSTAHASGSIKRALHQSIKPAVLCVDELGYLPIDKFGADCLFQIISHRYERGATLITTNRTYKQWASIFKNDAVLTSALLDRLLHHAETVLIEGKSYRSKNKVEV